MSKQILVDESLLIELKSGILEAINGVDGLDGAEGIYLLSGINIALGLPVDDYTLPTSAQQCVVPDATSTVNQTNRPRRG